MVYFYFRCRNEDLEWYIDMRNKGSAPTAGFGMGFERLIQESILYIFIMVNMKLIILQYGHL